MTNDRDDNHPPEEPEGGRRENNPGDRQLDEDAAWRAIVENYGERPQLDDVPVAPPEEPVADDDFGAVEPERFPSLERRWEDPLDSPADWEDEGHFVPPEPPPLPRVEPRRKLAWSGLFGAPVLMLVAVVLGWSFPRWVTGMLAAAFIGGFVYLVSTMPRSRGDDGSGDDGAVV